MRKILSTLALAGAILGGTYATHALGAAGENDAVGVSAVPISIDDALNTARTLVPGRAAAARFETEEGPARWQVEMVAAQQVTELSIDAHTGKVLAQNVDKIDHDDETDD